MPKIVGIRFKSTGKIYYFSPGEIEFVVGEGAIVETVRGIEFGIVALAPKDIDEGELKTPLKSVVRKAVPEDFLIAEKNLEKREEAIRIAKEKIAKHKLSMKLLDAEFTFDNSKVIFYFTSSTRVDFRELVKDLASHFRNRIELRQVGLRDESKILSGLGPCGRQCCCSSHLDDFERVSIKMVKIQGLSLNPTKISGLCGRLMCCLNYENDYYSETFRLMPKIGSDIITPLGEATVVANNILKRVVVAKIKGKDDSFELKSFPLEEIQAQQTMEIDSDNDDENDELAEMQE